MNPLFRDPSADEFEDYEYPDEPEDETTPTIVCPQCGADVYEEADQCPVCGTFLVDETNLWSGKPVWWILLGLLGIVAVVLALALGT